MRTISTRNKRVIIDEQIDVITELIETGLFQGPSYDQDESLFVYGFVYDSHTESIVLTRKIWFWDYMNSPLLFTAGRLTMEQIHAEFEKNKQGILTMKGCTEDQWIEMCPAYKIFDIEEFNLGISKLLPPRELSFDELVTYLKDHLETHYKHILDT